MGVAKPAAQRLRSFSPWQGTRATQQSSVATVLVVDSDGVSRRFIELALATENRAVLALSVESVRDAAGALEVLHTTRADLIVSETELPDMSGLRLFQLLRQESRQLGVPFVFLSADARVETKVVALRAGVDDYLVKPCDPNELCARVVGLLRRQRRFRAIQCERTHTLSGDFATMPFPDLMSILDISRRTGVLSITTARAFAELLLEDGRVVHAAFGNLIGPAAFYAIMGEERGKFEFALGSVPPAAGRSVTHSVTELLMESARLIDDQRQGGGASSEREPRPADLDPTASLDAGFTQNPADPPLGTPSLGAQFEMALIDAFSIGELRLWGRKEVAQWTHSEVGRDRLHIHLVTDFNQGIAALLSMAGPPAEGWVMSALSAEQKALGLAFFLRQERLIDILLLDIRNPNAFLDALHRRPAITIVAPASGDALEIGPRAMVALERLLGRLPPAVLLWVAQSPLATSMGAALSASRVLSLRGALGDQGLDLRQLLVTGVKAWSGRPSAAIPTDGANLPQRG